MRNFWTPSSPSHSGCESTCNNTRKNKRHRLKVLTFNSSKLSIKQTSITGWKSSLLPIEIIFDFIPFSVTVELPTPINRDSKLSILHFRSQTFLLNRNSRINSKIHWTFDYHSKLLLISVIRPFNWIAIESRLFIQLSSLTSQSNFRLKNFYRNKNSLSTAILSTFDSNPTLKQLRHGNPLTISVDRNQTKIDSIPLSSNIESNHQ